MLSPSVTLTKPITTTGNKYVPPHLRKSQGSGASNTNNSNPEETRPSYSRNYSSSSSFGSGRGGNRSGGYDRSYQDNRSSISSTASSRWNVDTSEQTRSNGAPPSSSFAASRGMSNTARTNARGFHGDMTPDKRLEQRLFSQKDHQTTGINFDNYDKIPCEISGENVPDPIEVYTTETIGDDLFRNTQLCHYTRPTPVQKYSIPIGQQGRDLMACAQTGSGKTAGFLFPIIMSMIKAGGQESPDPGRRRTTFPEALVLAPTRELAQQIYEEAVRFTYCTGIACVCIYGGADIRDQLRQIERGCDLLVATPGRLVDLIERGRIAMDNVRFLVLDEADRMLDMGFEPQIRRIVQEEGMPSGDGRQTMMFSATFPHNIQRLASDFMREYVFLTVGRVGSASKDVTQTVEYVEERSKIDVLMKFLLTIEDGLILIFVETKRSCDYIEDVLCRNHFPACSIHGDKSQSEREEALRSFKRGDTPVMVGTDVASRGLDIPNVTQVINYDLPSSIDDYVHRIGRTGRAGNTGSALSFINEKNIGIVRELRDMLAENDQVVPAWLDQMARATGFGGGKSGGRGGRSGGRGGGRGGGGNFGSRDVRYAQNNSGGGGRDNQHRGSSGGGYGGGGYGGGNTVGQFGDGAW